MTNAAPRQPYRRLRRRWENDTDAGARGDERDRLETVRRLQAQLDRFAGSGADVARTRRRWN